MAAEQYTPPLNESLVQPISRDGISLVITDQKLTKDIVQRRDLPRVKSDNLYSLGSIGVALETVINNRGIPWLQPWEEDRPSQFEAILPEAGTIPTEGQFAVVISDTENEVLVRAPLAKVANLFPEDLPSDITNDEEIYEYLGKLGAAAKNLPPGAAKREAELSFARHLVGAWQEMAKKSISEKTDKLNGIEKAAETYSGVYLPPEPETLNDTLKAAENFPEDEEKPGEHYLLSRKLMSRAAENLDRLGYLNTPQNRIVYRRSLETAVKIIEVISQKLAVSSEFSATVISPLVKIIEASGDKQIINNLKEVMEQTATEETITCLDALGVKI